MGLGFYCSGCSSAFGDAPPPSWAGLEGGGGHKWLIRRKQRGIDDVQASNYNVIMKVSVVQIGNSRGVRIPKAVLEQVGLRDEAEMEVRGSELIIRSANHPRAGWEAAFAKMAERGDDALLDAPTSTKWDETEWRW
jgi:antitoxin MazE